MEQCQDWYKSLGVDRTATHEEIKKAYRKLSMLYHPDRTNNDPNSTEKFKQMSAAYEILGDPEKKNVYDMMYLRNNMFCGTNRNDHTDIFNFLNRNSAQTFNKGNVFFRQENIQRPPVIVKTIELSLQQAFAGCTVPVDISRWFIEDNTRREERETVYVTIPNGIDDNEIIILKDKGNIINEANKGDLKIQIRIRNDTKFIRKGLDIILHKTISLKEALCGFVFELSHIDGRVFTIKNGNGNVISSNYKKMIPGIGMKRGEHKGNLIIIFEVVFPEKLTDEQVESIYETL